MGADCAERPLCYVTFDYPAKPLYDPLCGALWFVAGRFRPRGFILHNFINPRLFAACLVGEEGRISLALLTLPTRTADVAL